MQIIFNKNIQFTRLIKADGRLREFNFRRYKDVELGEIFSVNVVDNRDNRITFQLKKEDDAWKIVPQTLPAWITDNEAQFNEAIVQELKLP